MMNFRLCLTLVTMTILQVSSGNPWTNKKMDIYFMVDSTRTVWASDYLRELNFVNSLVRDMDIGPDKTRVALGIYGNEHILKVPLDNGLTKNALIDKIRQTQRITGKQRISRALHGMMTEGLASNVARQDVPRVGVLITDGESWEKQFTQDNATLAKSKGIFLFTIGVGKDVNDNELSTISSDPKSDYKYKISHFTKLEDIKWRVLEKLSKVELLVGDQNACGGNSKVDTVFVYDERSMGQESASKVRDFIKHFVGKIDMNSGNMRVGVVSELETCPTEHHNINLNEFLKRSQFVQGLDNQAQESKSRLTKLFSRAQEDAFTQENGGRIEEGVDKRIVLILDTPKVNGDLVPISIRSKYIDQIKVFVISLHTDMNNKSELMKLAFEKEDKYVMVLGGTNKLMDENIRDKFRHNFCEDI